MSAMEEETKTEQAPTKKEESEAPAASSANAGDKDEKMAEADNENDTKETAGDNAGYDKDAKEEDGDAKDIADDEEHNTNEGGGKRTYNRHNNRSSRRHTPYGRGQRAVYQHDNDSDPKKRVYVGNLSWDVTWRELKDHMKTTGCEVTRADVMATPDGRSKGCGIVEFATAEGASRAVLTLNDTELLGRQIFVREDREDGSGGGYYAQQIGGGGGGYHQNHSSGGGGGGGRFSSGGDSQSRRVYVGNLSWDVAWQDLKDHMRQAGEVAYAEVMTESDGRSKGCGIVEFASPDEAQEAISTLTDTELKGRMIFVREDRETASGGGGGGGGYHHGGGRHHGGYGSTSVYVGNLAYETSWQDLKDHMRAAGNVDQANILSSDDGRSKGCGIVQYQKPQEAARAIRELQNSELHGRPIFVREDREQGGGLHGGGGGGAGCQLFVGNLSYDTNWRDLKDHFRQCGDVERAEVMEAPDGRKKGFGTVRFYKQKDAQNAISRLNGVELQGRKLEVRIDHKA